MTFSSRQDREDGLDLRHLAFDAEPIIARLYFALRAPLWRTVGLDVVERRRRETADGFELIVRARSSEPAYPLEVRLEYRAEGPELEATMDAMATGAFDFARIGFCVLLDSATFVDRPCWAATRLRSWSFPFPSELVTPTNSDRAVERFHRAFDRLRTTTPGGTLVGLRFEGAPFEMEDQRNWSDASYKLYSINDEGPLHAIAGMRFRQRITISARPSSACAAGRIDVIDDDVTIGGQIGTMPPVAAFTGRVSAESLRPSGGFHELNSLPLPDLRGLDSIELPINGSVHAADDDSVMETTALHGPMLAQARRRYPGLPVHLAPLSFSDVAADWRDHDGNYAPEPPSHLPSRRLHQPIAATWILASVASAAPHNAASLRYFSGALPSETPAAQTLARLAALEGAPLLAVSGPNALAILAVREQDRITVAIANTGPDLRSYELPDGQVAELPGFASRWHHLEA